MTERLAFHARRRHLAAILAAVLFFAILIAATPALFAQTNSVGGRADACSGDNVRHHAFRPAFARPSSPTISAMPGTWRLRRTASVYVNTWSGRYYRNDTPPAGGFLVALKDSKGDGHADVIERFGEACRKARRAAPASPSTMAASMPKQNDKIIRYPLRRRRDRAERRNRKSSSPACRSPATIRCIPSSSMPRATSMSTSARRRIPARSKTGCRTRRVFSRAPNSKPAPAPGATKPIRPDQHFSAAERYATGLRNGEGFAFDSAGGSSSPSTAATSSSQNWPKLYTAAQSAKLPAEEIVELKQGADYGWPECYYDGELRTSLCWRRNMAATAARQLASAPRRRRRSRRFRRIGRRTIC